MWSRNKTYHQIQPREVCLANLKRRYKLHQINACVDKSILMLKNVLNLKDEAKQPVLWTSWLLVCHKKNYYLSYYLLFCAYTETWLKFSLILLRFYLSLSDLWLKPMKGEKGWRSKSARNPQNSWASTDWIQHTHQTIITSANNLCRHCTLCTVFFFCSGLTETH